MTLTSFHLHIAAGDVLPSDVRTHRFARIEGSRLKRKLLSATMCLMGWSWNVTVPLIVRKRGNR